MSKIEVNTVDVASGSTLTLGSSGKTIALASGTTNSINVKDISWQSVQTSSFTAVAGRGYPINTTGGAITLTLPASPSAGDMVAIVDYAGTFGSNAVTLNRNSSNIQGTAANGSIATNKRAVSLLYVDATKGWIPVNDNTTDNYGAQYVTATGGTVATVGDYKIHSFTSSSNFVVSDDGNADGSNSVDYLVVGAGGGSGNSNGGGGGAGGFRMASGLSVSQTTYPITIGAGGGANTCGPASGGPGATNGSNSVFATITSAGGGRGGSGKGSGPYGVGGDGGSGGGGGTNNQANGSGNTPPVSPAQGTDGGNGAGPGTPQPQAGGGGGGASQAGGSHKPAGGSAYGGDGSPAAPIFGSAPQPFYIANGSNHGASADGVFAGGGGGGRCSSNTGGMGLPNGEPGGTGGGGNSTHNCTQGYAGVANTGGGAGGGGYSPPGSGNTGGSGIVLIRYKYQG